MSHVTHVLSHVTLMSMWCIIRWAWTQVMSNMRESHVSYVEESCHTYECVMSHIWMSHVTHVMSHVTLMSMWCIIRWAWQWVMSNMRMSHVSYVHESCQICECVMPRWEWLSPYIWMSHATYLNESCHTCERVTSCKWVSHATYTSRFWTCECVMLHMWMSHATQMCVMFWACEWLNHVACVNESCHVCVWVTSHVWMSHATYV